MAVRMPWGECFLFWWSYLYRKLVTLWFEVKRPVIRFVLYEMIYSARKVLDSGAQFREPFGTSLVTTRFGTFRVRPRTADMAVVSPAFERRDLDHLFRLLAGLRRHGRRVFFVDAGADLGTYTISVATRFRDWAGLRILAFEPASSSFALLAENLTLNGLSDRVEAHCSALFDRAAEAQVLNFNASAPGSSALGDPGMGAPEAVRAVTLDAVLAPRLEASEVLVLKLDCEGAEPQILEGARVSIASAAETYALVEDFLDPRVEQKLRALGASLLVKRTPYNSWWQWTRGALSPRQGEGAKPRRSGRRF